MNIWRYRKCPLLPRPTWPKMSFSWTNIVESNILIALEPKKCNTVHICITLNIFLYLMGFAGEWLSSLFEPVTWKKHQPKGYNLLPEAVQKQSLHYMVDCVRYVSPLLKQSWSSRRLVATSAQHLQEICLHDWLKVNCSQLVRSQKQTTIQQTSK